VENRVGVFEHDIVGLIVGGITYDSFYTPPMGDIVSIEFTTSDRQYFYGEDEFF